MFSAVCSNVFKGESAANLLAYLPIEVMNGGPSLMLGCLNSGK